MIPPPAPRHQSANTLRLGAVLTVVMCATLAGCAPTPTPTPTPTPAFASEEEAFAAAEDTYRAYNDALNAVDLGDPATFEAVFEFSSGDFEKADRRTLSELHAAKYSFTGRTVVTAFKGLASDLLFERITAAVCVDVSDSDVVDQSGHSVAEPERPGMNPLLITFVALDGHLSIDHADRDEDDSCTG